MGVEPVMKLLRRFSAILGATLMPLPAALLFAALVPGSRDLHPSPQVDWIQGIYFFALIPLLQGFVAVWFGRFRGWSVLLAAAAPVLVAAVAWLTTSSAAGEGQGMLQYGLCVVIACTMAIVGGLSSVVMARLRSRHA
jgi:hypothetical protein